ncbi:AAA family ATPase [Scopulibacillus cellulosilyticus]|uniref:Flagellar biosynthesis protein FlhF n=1 Tax=Scopulibacillus cellulosilyticus TaxID=2665665 RepID=A0ABW2PT33_9BACL
MKKITAPTMSEAMAKVKKELGSDAVILYTKKVYHGRFFFKKEKIEVIAAEDPDPVTPTRNKIVAKAKQSPLAKVVEETVYQPVQSFDKHIPIPNIVFNFRKRLLEQGITSDEVDRLTKHLVKNWYKSDETLLETEMKNCLSEEIARRIISSRFKTQTKKKFIALVGPTGVGKTTTIAKLAAQAILDEGKTAAFITTDTYRIAAIDQLKTYAQILKVPVEVAYSSADFKEAVSRLKNVDIIFIDTAGRNFHKDCYIQELQNILPQNNDLDTYLVLAATSKYNDMARIIHQFSILPDLKLIFTKMDETLTVGDVINVLFKNPYYEVAYFSNGQNVPDDLIKANIEDLINHLLEEKNERSS